MKAAVLLISLCILNIGCAVGLGVRPAFEQNGHQIFESTCNGTRRSITDCHRQASEQCGGHFEIVGGANETSGLYPIGDTMIAGIKRTMLFKCLRTPQKMDINSGPSVGQKSPSVDRE